MTIDLQKPVTIRGYTGRITRLEEEGIAISVMLYEVELVDLTPEANIISMRGVHPDEIHPCV